jgi:hypothetical protein
MASATGFGNLEVVFFCLRYAGIAYITFEVVVINGATAEY